MLRGITSVGRQVYTCTCLHRPLLGHPNIISAATETIVQGLAYASLPASRSLKTSACLQSLDKDVKNKKSIIKATHAQRNENFVSDEQEIEGLSTAGMITPTLETHSMLIDGVRYDQLHIAHIKSTANNTLISITDYQGNILLNTTCGSEGFRTAKKGTNIAAQATGISAATKAINKGIRSVRVAVKGFGIGRLPSIKGLEMGGLKIISITDNTPIPFNGPRPRKARRV